MTAESMTQLRDIDSHQHFWRLSRADYGWLTPDFAPLYRDFLPSDLAPELRQQQIDATVLVQAAPTAAETDFLLALAEQTDFVAAVVGWVDMAHPKTPQRIRQRASNPWLRGLRPMIQDVANPAWMLEPELTPAFEAIIEQDLSFDALVLPRHLDNLLRLLKRHPRLRCVIDHGAKPRIAAGCLDPWRSQMTTLAEQTTAYCKLSGLVTEAGKRTDREYLQPYVDHLLNCFGPKRLMWGSDWPVVTAVLSYQRWRTLTDELLRSLSEADANRILGETAAEFYQL